MLTFTHHHYLTAPLLQPYRNHADTVRPLQTRRYKALEEVEQKLFSFQPRPCSGLLVLCAEEHLDSRKALHVDEGGIYIYLMM